MTKIKKPIEQIKPIIIAAIPCLNEGKFIDDIVTQARKHVDTVIVIDDGSTDNTSEVAKASGAEVIRHERSWGAGAATKSAFEAAKTNNADILVTLDSFLIKEASSFISTYLPEQVNHILKELGLTFKCY